MYHPNIHFVKNANTTYNEAAESAKKIKGMVRILKDSLTIWRSN